MSHNDESQSKVAGDSVDASDSANVSNVSNVSTDADALDNAANDAADKVMKNALKNASHSRDEIVAAARILKSASSKKRERKAAAAIMSKTGGAKRGGENRAKNLTPEQRRDIARLGGLARQQKAREEDERLGFALPRNKALTRREIRLKADETANPKR